MRAIALVLAPLAAACSTVTSEPAPPASVAVVFDRETITRPIIEGFADRGTGRPVEANDPVRIASISKLIMALATLQLVDEGKVELGTDVSDYLGWKVRHPDYPDVPVTLAQLLMHRSGLRDDAGYVVPLGESLKTRLAEPEAWYRGAPPGDAPFEYANLGSPLVATVLEAASGERYDRLVDRTIFAPLGIEACLNWIGCSQGFADSAVVLYRSGGEVARDDAADRPPNCTIPVGDGEDCSLENYQPGTNASIFSPQGGVRIGMEDLAKIGQELLKPAGESFFSERVLGELLFSLMAAPKDVEFFCGYGAGIQMIEVPNHGCNDALFGDGKPRIGHAGEAYGLRSGLWLDHEGGTGIAYFVTAVPDRTAPDEGGFAPEEVALVRRAQEMTAKAGK